MAIYDVTVVGAGPVGLMLATELAVAGVSVQVLERRAQPEDPMKAQSINVPTAEALDRRGLLSAAEAVQRDLLERMGSFARLPDGGAPASRAPDTRFTGHFAGMTLDPDRVDWSDPDLAAHTAAGAARMVPQYQLEAILAKHAEQLGVTVCRGVEVTDLEDTGNGVDVVTTTGTVNTGWLVGCDGGHSVVRRLAGIEFVGTDPEFTGYQAVVDIVDPEKLANGWAWSRTGVYRHGPQPGRISTVEFNQPPADRSTPITIEELQCTLRRVSGTDVTLTALRATPTRWTDNTRQALTYRSGRVLLAGDAAHVHSPFGGQGLNLGVGDATNLGWKLGAVIAGWAPPGLLDTYDTERRPIGAWVLDWTRAQIGVLRGDAKSAALRGIVADLLSTRDGTTYAVKKISGVDQRIEFPGGPPDAHPLTGRHAPDLWLCDSSRLTDHGHRGGFVLLDRTPEGVFAHLAARWTDRLTSVTDDSPTVSTHPDDKPPLAAVFVRPDGVVAWASNTNDTAALADLEAALHRWAGKPTTVASEHGTVD